MQCLLFSVALFETLSGYYMYIFYVFVQKKNMWGSKSPFICILTKTSEGWACVLMYRGMWTWTIVAIDSPTPCSLVLTRGGISSPWVPNHATLSNTFQLVPLPQRHSGDGAALLADDRSDERLSAGLEWKLVDLVIWKQCHCILPRRSLTEV